MVIKGLSRHDDTRDMTMRVLVVERDEWLRGTMAMNLLLEGFDVDEAASVMAARDALAHLTYDAVVLGEDVGPDAAMAMKEQNPRQELLVLGGARAPVLTHTAHLPKPVAIVDVVRWLDGLQLRSTLMRT